MIGHRPSTNYVHNLGPSFWFFDPLPRHPIQGNPVSGGAKYTQVRKNLWFSFISFPR